MKDLIKFGCKECGSPHVRERDGKLFCVSCGAWFEKNVETNEERDARVLYLTRLDRAEELLSMSPPRFDDAEDHFREFIKHYPNQSDGYWGLVRARYGIKYETDITGKKIPSCYKFSYEDFRRDSDFMKALSYAENDGIYDNLQEQAKLIAGVCKEWHEETKKYNYDIFISFKAQDKALGISDEDQREMNALYDFLKDQGYSVFFSPRSMRLYTGRHYDAYIFNALQKARIMIVYGSKPEYFTATWVQNEWTRFLRMEAKGEKKKGSCIVAYNGFNPKELPHELEKLQAVDASQKRFYNDVFNSIKRILTEEKKVDTNEELMRKIESLERKNEENKKENEALKKSLEEEKRRNNTRQNEKKAEDPLKNSEAEERDNRLKEEIIRMEADFAEKLKKQKERSQDKKAPASTSPKKNATDDNSKYSKAPYMPRFRNVEYKKADPDFEIWGGILTGYIGNKSKVVIPESVTAIDKKAFAGRSDVTDIAIHDKVSSINGYAFSDTAYYNNERNWKNNALYISDHLIKARNGLSGKYKIKSGAVTIADYAFINCDKLTEVVMPHSVTAIGEWAFYNCLRLNNAIISYNTVSIGTGAFYNCQELKKILIPQNVKRIGGKAFSSCSSLTDAVVVGNINCIDEWTFSGCSSLANIVIPKSVTTIGAYAFAHCDKLANIYYTGTPEEWRAIKIESDNYVLKRARIHCNYVI